MLQLRETCVFSHRSCIFYQYIISYKNTFKTKANVKNVRVNDLWIEIRNIGALTLTKLSVS
jgi:3'-phosphoadenosine 5'-phosphosulfate sulfotransferase